MNNDPPESSAPATPQTAATTSELNNLLEIISGTSAAIENIWEGNKGSEKYFEMLRTSVDRAAKVTAQLAEHAGGSDQKVLFHPELAAFARQKNPPPPPAAKKRSLLVVDDEPMVLVLSKSILSEAGFEVVTAQSGFECLDLFRKRPHHFDLVVLDLSMPFMNGEETFTRLKSIRPDVAVMLSTGFIDQERLDRMLGAGMAGFLRKPHRPSELVANINAILESVKMSRAGCLAGGSTCSF